MINLDTRLLDKLNGEELAVFCHIVNTVNNENESFITRNKLIKKTSFSREKVAKTLKSLSNKNIIRYYQKKNKKGRFSKTCIVITTNLFTNYKTI